MGGRTSHSQIVSQTPFTQSSLRALELRGKTEDAQKSPTIHSNFFPFDLVHSDHFSRFVKHCDFVSFAGFLFLWDGYCSLFLNWNEERLESDGEVAAVLRSLVATLQSNASLDDSLEGKAVRFLKYVSPLHIKSTTALLHSFASNSDESLSIFIQSIVVLLSSASKVITKAAIRMLDFITICSVEVRLALAKADLIPQLINTLNPPSLSFTETVDIHSSLLHIVTNSFWLASPYCLAQLGIEDRNEQLAVHEATTEPAPHSPVCVAHLRQQLKNGPIHSRFVVGWDALADADIDVDATGCHPSPLGADPLLGLACSRHLPCCLSSTGRGADRFRRDGRVMARAGVRDLNDHWM
ncbi:hypothetical protein BLNAU_21749 [Blattamonas nauphoetae]|uniref:Uncharacterized protein n=1 Tax=Blattamonas nauphoetae TaxID=2049346 RepID=A0ABQ9WUZ2_9EUKA|nr:hypothetical protein BLNAU_21749 [Blattamonas nauphoetae]